MVNPDETHSEEVDFAIWRMHHRGYDGKGIANKLKDCEIDVTRRYVSAAIRRGNMQYMPTSLPSSEEAVETQTAIQEISFTDNGVLENVSVVTGQEQMSDSGMEEPGTSAPFQVESHVEIAAEADNDSDSDDLDEDIMLIDMNKMNRKNRRIKTTDDLIRRLQEDFLQYPERKVKERAQMFGIAVGTLCQIKHNVLKLPKETGRTWKSTPQMVEDIATDLKLQPNMKVKDRAKKFGISVGTLCRILHDILELPKREIACSPRGKRGHRRSKTRKDNDPHSDLSTLDAIALRAIREDAGRKATAMMRKPRKKRRVELPIRTQSSSSAKSGTAPQICQMEVKSEATGPVLVLTFDPTDSDPNIPISVTGNSNNEELVWVLNEHHSDAEVTLTSTSPGKSSG